MRINPSRARIVQRIITSAIARARFLAVEPEFLLAEEMDDQRFALA
jgi:hypothetical protein